MSVARFSSPYTEEIELAIQIPLPPSCSSFAAYDSNAFTGSEPPQASEQRQDDSVDAPSERNVSSLPPVDGGYMAWTFLLGGFIVEALVWGIPNSFGVFLESYLQDPTFASQTHASSLLPLIGTLSTGIMYCSGPFLYPLLSRFPRYRRMSLWVGVILSWAGLFGASYATKVRDLLVLQGILYAFGGALLYWPCMSFMSEWFVKRRGLANGVINAGTAAGGLILPPLLPHLFERYGRPKTLRILSSAMAILITTILPFLKPRLPEINSTSGRNSARPTSRWHPWSIWLSNPLFLLSMAATTVQALAYFIPVLYLPSFTTSVSRPLSSATLALALLNGTSVLSRIALGLLSDRLDPLALAIGAAGGTALVTFVLWGVVAQRLTTALPGLLTFGVAYGAFAGGWSSLFSGFIRPVAKDDPKSTTSLYGVLMFVRGLGNILSTPISSALLHGASTQSTAPKGGHDGGGYERMIIYVGSCFAGAGVIALLGFGMERSWKRQT